MQYQFGWTKAQLFQKALVDVQEFLNINDIPEPKIHDVQARRTGNKFQHYGLYLRLPEPTVYVNVPWSTTPRKEKGFIWSYPGHKTDRTAAGILAHEIGHHVSFHRFYTAIGGRRRLNSNWNKWLEVCRSAPPVTSYCPNADEDFAETMRLFILNPNLLSLGRPPRFKFIREMGVLPIQDQSWEVILHNAPPYIKQAAKKFAGEE